MHVCKSDHCEFQITFYDQLMIFLVQARWQRVLVGVIMQHSNGIQ